MPRLPYTRPAIFKPTPVSKPSIRPASRGQRMMTALNEWKTPFGTVPEITDSLWKGFENLKEGMSTDVPLPETTMLPVMGPAAVAGLIVPPKMYQARIDRVVEGMKRNVSKLKDIRAGEKFVSEMERWMRELHPRAAAHVNEFRIYNQADADRLIGKGYGGHYKSAEKHQTRWPTTPGVPSRVENLKRYKGKAAEARIDPNHPWNDPNTGMKVEDYDALLDNAIEIRERPDLWADPLQRFGVAKHEYGHAGQELGFSEQFDEGLKRYQSFLSDKVPKPHLYPPEPMEIGARVTARKAPFDAGRLGMASEAPPGTSFERPNARDLWKEEILSGANQSNAYLKKGSGRNIQQGIANRTIPDVNRALQFRQPLEPTILPPSSQRRIINPASGDTNWSRQNYDWGRHGKYSLFIDDTGPAMSIDELIARGYLR
jgi:hypothetical protein